jgi:hypothetical protein
MRQIITDLHAPIVVCAGCPTEDAVAHAELTRWYLKGILKVKLAYDERRYLILRLVVDHVDEFCASGCAVYCTCGLNEVGEHLSEIFV